MVKPSPWPLTFALGKESYTLSVETLAKMREVMKNTENRERGFALLGKLGNLMPGEEIIGSTEGMMVNILNARGFFHSHPNREPELSPNDWVHVILATGELGFPFLECSGSNGDVYCTTVDDINNLTIPKDPTDDELDELVQHLVKPYHFKLFD